MQALSRDLDELVGEVEQLDHTIVDTVELEMLEGLAGQGAPGLCDVRPARRTPPCPGTACAAT
ncbi:hypothetical protein E4P41_13605 [Geodermatophilus sp. DF01-2]|uniref:hypothetical protein n=1 Tax=Geodermatophilus sp. DF01-2 TaxID=2559610 RepID=UPI0010741670|nr:hypothetical protein [Geodermatophilus sp. DF01_2]TFV57961.1 hypothetical protein E4P41_13605 [Geodermatophilus sp. DF01_2]